MHFMMHFIVNTQTHIHSQFFLFFLIIFLCINVNIITVNFRWNNIIISIIFTWLLIDFWFIFRLHLLLYLWSSWNCKICAMELATNKRFRMNKKNNIQVDLCPTNCFMNSNTMYMKIFIRIQFVILRFICHFFVVFWQKHRTYTEHKIKAQH